jgi:hypothetical protein
MRAGGGLAKKSEFGSIRQTIQHRPDHDDQGKTMAVEYWEDGIHDGSRKSSKSGGKRKALIVVDDDHPFDLHAYISQYIGVPICMPL